MCVCVCVCMYKASPHRLEGDHPFSIFKSRGPRKRPLYAVYPFARAHLCFICPIACVLKATLVTLPPQHSNVMQA